MKNLLFVLFSLLFLSNIAIAQNDATQELLDEYVNILPEKAEVAIGIIKNGKKITKGFQKKNGVLIPVDNSMHIFEIGSMTKTFTAALLIDQVKNGNMKMDDSIMKYFSEKDNIENNQFNAIKLQHLINHTSGLDENPRSYIFPAIRGKLYTYGNPYIFIKWRHFRKSLRKGVLNFEPGKKFVYNNSAFALLGMLIAREEHTTWEALVQAKIFDKLGMKNSYPTGKNVPDEFFIQGYNEESEPSDYWDMDFINPAGSIKSCVNDQLLWLSAHLDATENSIFEEMKKDYNIDAAWKNNVIGNAWIHQIQEDEHFIWHGGATGAFRSFSAFDDKEKTAVIILTNFKHNHPQMRDENNKSLIRKYGFNILRSLSKAFDESTASCEKK